MNNEIHREGSTSQSDNSARTAFLDELHQTPNKARAEVSNPLSAFGNGLLKSVENSYNGTTQLLNGKNYEPVSIASRPASDSKVASYAYSAGEIVGTGVQMIALSRVMPKSHSIAGRAVSGGATGGVFGGVLQPTEGANLAEERFKSGLSMAAFMGTYESARIVGFGVKSMYGWGMSSSIARGAAAGGLAGVAHESASSGLNDKELTVSGLGSSFAKGALLGSAMEMTSAIAVRTNPENMLSTGFAGAKSSKLPRPADLEVPGNVNNPELLASKRLAEATQSSPLGVKTRETINSADLPTPAVAGHPRPVDLRAPGHVNNPELLASKRLAESGRQDLNSPAGRKNSDLLLGTPEAKTIKGH